MLNKKLIIFGAVALIALITFTIINPFSYNEGGNRTVVEQTDGTQFVQFKSGIFYAGFFSKEKEWPNQISVLFNDSIANYDFVDNGIDIGVITIFFNDATSGKQKGIV
jgi:hypothetical protein